MMICKNCGVELEKDMEYCPICGKAVAGPADQVKDAADQQRSAFSLKRNPESGNGIVQRFFSWFKRTFHV